MKYGIITFHNIPNIGALLQAYSLCKTIRSLGADCEIIDYRCENIKKRELVYKPHPNIFKDIILRLFWHKTKKKIKLCQEYMQSKHIYSNKIYDSTTIISANNDYDGFISGSDMIWNLGVTGYDYNYFHEFVENSKMKFSYGSSIGDKWEGKDMVKIRFLLSRYDKLSVREKDTCHDIQNMGLKCKYVVDPTMLISSEEWRNEAYIPKQKGYVLVYFASKEIINNAKKYAKKHGLKVVYITSDYPKPHVINVSPNTPPEWIGYFFNASAIFTNSFHGLLFSLYFKKPVWSANYGNRIVSLLETLGLSYRLLKNDSNLDSTIEYNDVTNKIEIMRQDSLNYLMSIIQYRPNL